MSGTIEKTLQQWDAESNETIDTHFLDMNRLLGTFTEVLLAILILYNLERILRT